MSTQLDAEVQDNLRTMMEKFFNALQEGVDGLSSFSTTFTDFHKTLERQRCHLTPETLDTIPQFIDTINAIASSIIELEIASDAICREHDQEISSALNSQVERLTIQEDAEEKPLETVKTSTPYTRLAYQWLLKNLHNPYPPKEIIVSICRQTGSLPRNINSWFIDARKRIGWNDLRNDRFGKRKEAITKAATLFFKPETRTDKSDSRTPKHVLAPEDHFAFESIRVAAMSLYSQPSFVSPRLDNSDSDTGSQSQSVSRISPTSTLVGAKIGRKRTRSCSSSDADRDVEVLYRQKRARLNRSSSAPYSNPAPYSGSREHSQVHFSEPSSSGPIEGPLRCRTDGKRKRDSSDDDGQPKKRTCLIPPVIPNIASPPISDTFNEDIFSAQIDWSAIEALDFSAEFPPYVRSMEPFDVPVEINCYQFDLSSANLLDAPLSPLLADVLSTFDEDRPPTPELTTAASPATSLASSDLSSTFDSSSPDCEVVPIPVKHFQSFDFDYLLHGTDFSFDQHIGEINSVFLEDQRMPVFDLSGVDGFGNVHPSGSPLQNAIFPSNPPASDNWLPIPMVLGNHNANVVGLGPSYADDRIVKQRRAQLLRAELRRLEAEVF